MQLYERINNIIKNLEEDFQDIILEVLLLVC